MNLPALQTLLEAHPSPESRQLKFVVSATEAQAGRDLAEIESLLAQLRGWNPDDVLLMPEGVHAPAPDHRARVLDACLKRGWRYCHRLHIELFGHTRGT